MVRVPKSTLYPPTDHVRLLEVPGRGLLNTVGLGHLPQVVVAEALKRVQGMR